MIDYYKCKYIKTIAECKSFSQAAKKLYVAQPSLSRYIKKVEKQLGFELFDRSTMPLTLTPAGEKYLDYINKFIQLEELMKNDFANMNISLKKKLRIASLPLLGQFIFPQVVPTFSNQFPNIELEILEGNIAILKDLMTKRQADLVISNLPASLETFKNIKLVDDPVAIVTGYKGMWQKYFPENHSSIYNPIELDYSLLSKFPCLVLKPWQNMRSIVTSVLKDNAIMPQKLIEAPSVASAVTLASLGQGITFATPSQMACIPVSEPLIYFQVKNAEKYTAIYAVFHKEDEGDSITTFCHSAIESLAKKLRSSKANK